MNKTLLRISGIIFFVAVLTMAMPVLSRSLDSFAFFIASPEVGWGLYFIVTACIFATFFFMAIFSTGTAAIFAGGSGYTQSVWNCGIYSLFAIGIFTSQLILTGITEDEEYLLVLCMASIVGMIVYNALVYVSLRKAEGFYWKNLLPQDKSTKLCLKVYALMLAVVEIGAFLYAHKLVE